MSGFQNCVVYFELFVQYKAKYQNIREHDGEGLYVGKTLPYGIHEFLTAAREKGYHVEDPNGIQRESNQFLLYILRTLTLRHFI